MNYEGIIELLAHLNPDTPVGTPTAMRVGLGGLRTNLTVASFVRFLNGHRPTYKVVYTFEVKTRDTFLVSILIFGVLTIALPHSLIPTDTGNIILTVTAFLFGIIAGFYIVVTTTDYNSVKTILATETAQIIGLYDNVRVYDPASAKKIAERIDTYVRRNFDFELIDYARSTTREFEALEKAVRELPIKQELGMVYQEIRATMRAIVTAREQLVVLGTRTLSTLQWVILLVLGSLFILSLYAVRPDNLFFDLGAVAISSSMVLVLLLIRELDLYIWNERTFAFEIFERVFVAIGVLPYYPAESVEEKRIYPREKEYRIGVLLTKNPAGERRIETRLG